MVLLSGISRGLEIRYPQETSRTDRELSGEAKVTTPRKYSQRVREDSAKVTQVDEGEKACLFPQGLIRQAPTELKGQSRDLGLG